MKNGLNEPSALANIYSPIGEYWPQPLDVDFRNAYSRNLLNYFYVLQRHRKLAVACFFLTFSVLALLVLASPPLFTSSSRVLVARQSPIQLRLDDNVLHIADGDAGQAGINFNATQVAALQSRDLAERVIREQRLAQSASFLRPVSLPGRLLRALRRWYLLPAATLTELDLIDIYMSYLTVQEVRGTDLIEIDFTTADPALSALLAEAHTEAFVAANEEARRATDLTAKNFLSDQLGESQKRVEDAGALLYAFAAEHPNVAVNQEQNSIAQRISEISTLLTGAEAERVTLESRRDLLGEQGSDAIPYFLDRPGIQKLRLQLIDLTAQVAALSQRLGSEHPQMLELRRQEKALNRQLRAEVVTELRAIQSQYDAARVRERSLRRKLTDLEDSAIVLRDLGTHYDELKKDVETSRKLHESLLKQQIETTVNSDLSAPSLRLIQRPEVPKAPSSPRIFLDLFLGMLAGLVAAVGAVFARECFDSRMTSTEEVEAFLRLPALAAIPNVATLENGNGAASHNGKREAANGRAELLVLQEPWSQIAEAFRTMKTGVLFSANGARTTPKVILVTSALAGEGKTFGSLNLAATLAEAGARVLLVDADLRHARCHTALGVESDRGLSTVLAGKAAPADVIKPTRTPRLFFVAAGPRPANPAELVSSGGIEGAIENWRMTFNFVILDSPPALAMSDAVVLAQHVDGVVLVVKGDKTPRELVRRTRDRFVRSGAQLLGVVINNVGRTWGDPYFFDIYDESNAGPVEAPLEAEKRA